MKITVVHNISDIDADKEVSDVIVCAHTHKPLITRLAHKIIVNPGECCGWLFNKPSVALIDPDLQSARICYL